MKLVQSAQSGPSVPASLARSAAALHYLQNLGSIDGWLDPTTALAIVELLWLQEGRAVSGNLAEIGVYRGKSLLALAAGARAEDTLFAIDPFDSVAANTKTGEIDNAYGTGNRQVFEANLRAIFPQARVCVIARSSAELRGREAEFGLTGLRFLSIDGGHTRALTSNDLQIADACLTEGGIACLDDVLNAEWTGVVSGLFDFLRSEPRLVPFALVPNKLLLCRQGWRAFYASGLRSLFSHALVREQVEFHDAKIDVYGDGWSRIGGTFAGILSRLADHAADRSESRAAEAEAREQIVAQQVAEARRSASEALAWIEAVRSSTSWRVTAPLRRLGRVLRDTRR
jgi:Methyltransferase domain